MQLFLVVSLRHEDLATKHMNGKLTAGKFLFYYLFS